MSKVIHTEHAPAAIGPYSGDDIAAQTEQSRKNIRSILQAAGADLENVVKTTVLLQNIGDFAAMNEVYAKFFTKDCPARAAFEVAALPKGALVEIEAIAVKG